MQLISCTSTQTAMHWSGLKRLVRIDVNGLQRRDIDEGWMNIDGGAFSKFVYKLEHSKSAKWNIRNLQTGRGTAHHGIETEIIGAIDRRLADRSRKEARAMQRSKGIEGAKGWWPGGLWAVNFI